MKKDTSCKSTQSALATTHNSQEVKQDISNALSLFSEQSTQKTSHTNAVLIKLQGYYQSSVGTKQI